MTQSEELFRALIYIEELLDCGEIDKAYALCIQLEDLYPENEDFLFVYAITLQLQEKPKEAISIFARLIQNPSCSCEIWNNYAFLLFEERQYQESEKILSEALSIDPQNAFSWWLLCLLRTFSGSLDAANRAYLYTQWLDPDMYPPLQFLEEEQLRLILEKTIATLSYEKQSHWRSLIWNITDIPNPNHIASLDTSPLKPIIYFEQSTATLHLYRYNIAHLKLDPQTVQEIFQEELDFFYTHSPWLTAQA